MIFAKNRLFILFLLAIAIANLYIYHIASKKTKFDIFLSEIKYGIILLDGLDKNKTDVIKAILASDINRIFIEANKNDYSIESFKPICEYITIDNMKLIKKFDIKNIKIDANLSKGRKKIYNLCKKD